MKPDTAKDLKPGGSVAKAQEYIKWTFLNPKSPACFTSSVNVLLHVQKKFPNTTIHDVEDILQRIPTYTLHKARRTHFERLRTVTAGFMEDVQVDLADFQKVADQNNGYKYILVYFGIFYSRFRWGRMFCREGFSQCP